MNETEEAVARVSVFADKCGTTKRYYIRNGTPPLIAKDLRTILTALASEREARERAERERDEARDDADYFKDRLHDVVVIEAEAWAIGGGPGFKDRKEKAWSRAREPFEP